MARKHKHRPKSAKNKSSSLCAPVVPRLNQLLGIASHVDLKTDIAVANLACASGLPGAVGINVDDCLKWLDEAAERVRFETERNYPKFLDSPESFEHSQARFCMICLVTVLQRQFGVGYNPKWKGLTPDNPVPRTFGKDAADLFIHAIIEGIGGTCGSLPVLYAAVGRRLGYPLRIVKAARHLFVRWDDPQGKLWLHPDRFNIEATGPGVHFLPDDHYRIWPHALPEEDIEAGVFLRSLSPSEELAEFVATRGYCLSSNGRLADAAQCLAEASRLSPQNRHLASSLESLQVHIAVRRRGHAYLNAPVHSHVQEYVRPFWTEGFGGPQDPGSGRNSRDAAVRSSARCRKTIDAPAVANAERSSGRSVVPCSQCPVADDSALAHAMRWPSRVGAQAQRRASRISAPRFPSP